MTNLDLIWNRAADGKGTGDGDVALAAALLVHGMVMNGGALNAVETIDAEDLADGKEGFRWLGLEQVADLFTRIEAEAAEIDHDDEEARDDLEVQADDDYYALLPDDAALEEAFTARHAEEPDAFDAL
ncbi:DMP19 family protein [Tessaracoccus massiliensis]|uniref:DMP19 family protein n=1 Tax=Tessaracoccus massiliensis TaxID=1522311 RepID=UPI000591564D|nr:hypothetical protein [Tessaracoccus massiliensis]